MLGLGAILLIAAGAAVYWNSGGGSQSKKVPLNNVGVSTSHERPRSQTPASGGKLERRSAEEPSADPAVLAQRAEAKKAVLESLNDAATTYDAAQLPFINKFLYDGDPEIRKAARDAMLVLGDASAGKMLREAGETATNEQERSELMKAADYAELPTVNLKQMQELRKQQGGKVEIARDPNRRGFGKKRSQEQGQAPAPESPAPAPVPAPESSPAPLPAPPPPEPPRAYQSGPAQSK